MWSEICNKIQDLSKKHCEHTEMFCCFSESELIAYSNSWDTITNCTIENKDDLFTVKIKSVDDDPQWLNVVGRKIWLEKDK